MSPHNTPKPTWRKLASLILVNGQLDERPTRHKLVNAWLAHHSGNFLPAQLYQDILQAILSVLARTSEQPAYGEIDRAASIQIYLPEDIVSVPSNNSPRQFSETTNDSDPDPEIQISGHLAVGSWGYFLVERTEYLQDSPGRLIFLKVEVYLYSEC